MTQLNRTVAILAIMLLITAIPFTRQCPSAFADINPPASSVGPDGKPVPTMKTLEKVKQNIPIKSLPFEITTSGGYYLTSNLTGTQDTKGITISASQVTLDMKGFTLYGNSAGSGGDGIVVNGEQKNIFIHNGNIVDWKGDGVDASTSVHSVFKNLKFRENQAAGLKAGSYAIVTRCVVMHSGYNTPDGSTTPTFLFNANGIEAGSGSTVKNTVTNNNGGSGIVVADGSSIIDCTAYKNTQNGFQLSAGSTINRSVATDNGGSAVSAFAGFKLSSGASAIECSAYDNFGNGFEYDSVCSIISCIASLNNGNGFYGGANGQITGNKAHENDLAGIHITGTGSRIENNNITDNDVDGLKVDGTGHIIVRNYCAGNLANYTIAAGNSHGPIVDLTYAGDVSTSGILNSDHPMANTEY